MDGVALAMPIGLGIVRIGNFLNGELYGKPTNGDWFYFTNRSIWYPSTSFSTI